MLVGWGREGKLTCSRAAAASEDGVDGVDDDSFG